MKERSPTKPSSLPSDSGHEAQPGAFVPAFDSESVPLHETQIALLERTFLQVETQSEIAALIFFRNLFTLNPALRPLFQLGVEVPGRRLMQSLRATVTALKKPAELIPFLKSTGRRLAAEGVKDEHYAPARQALLEMLREVLGREFNSTVGTAWERALGFFSQTMISGTRVKADANASGV